MLASETMSTETKKALQGGEFLIRASNPQDIFIPEEFNEEQRMIAQTAVDFLAAEVWPNLERIDHLDRSPKGQRPGAGSHPSARPHPCAVF